jgi:hypothetical protein
VAIHITIRPWYWDSVAVTNINHINFYLGHGIISLLGNPERFVTCRDGGVFLLTKTSALNSFEVSLALVIWWAWFVTASVKPYEPGLIFLAAVFYFFIPPPPFFLLTLATGLLPNYQGRSLSSQSIRRRGSSWDLNSQLRSRISATRVAHWYYSCCFDFGATSQMISYNNSSLNRYVSKTNWRRKHAELKFSRQKTPKSLDTFQDQSWLALTPCWFSHPPKFWGPLVVWFPSITETSWADSGKPDLMSMIPQVYPSGRNSLRNIMNGHFFHSSEQIFRKPGQNN